MTKKCTIIDTGLYLCNRDSIFMHFDKTYFEKQNDKEEQFKDVLQIKKQTYVRYFMIDNSKTPTSACNLTLSELFRS